MQAYTGVHSHPPRIQTLEQIRREWAPQLQHDAAIRIQARHRGIRDRFFYSLSIHTSHTCTCVFDPIQHFLCSQAHLLCNLQLSKRALILSLPCHAGGMIFQRRDSIQIEEAAPMRDFCSFVTGTLNRAFAAQQRQIKEKACIVIQRHMRGIFSRSGFVPEIAAVREVDFSEARSSNSQGV